MASSRKKNFEFSLSFRNAKDLAVAGEKKEKGRFGREVFPQPAKRQPGEQTKELSVWIFVQFGSSGVGKRA